MLRIDFYKQNSKYISTSEFFKVFDEYWYGIKKSFKKFECLQYYDESEDCALKHLLNNDLNAFANKLHSTKVSEKKDYIEALSKGIVLQRLHFVEFPISSYIEFEYYSYYITSSLGENIFFDDISKHKDIYPLNDFMIFDNSNLLMNHYDSNGKLVGAWNLTDNKELIIKEITDWYDISISKSSDYKQICTPKKEILELII
ncbi:MAG: hypothetical protein N2749_04755 [Clostridia bacterium]|nr:hypothetical protein [Clostridia bacterium]